GRGQLDRITGVPQVGEVDALDDPSVVDVQTRDHPYGKTHRAHSSSAPAPARANASRPLPGSGRQRSARERPPEEPPQAGRSGGQSVRFARSRTACSTTLMPSAHASGVEYSRGLWLMPSYSPGTNTIPAGHSAAISDRK